MARHAGLPWDIILSAETAKHYKRDREVYEHAAEMLSEPPERMMMVAAHKGDLEAAREVGFKTAFVRRLLEHGPDRTPDVEREEWMDVYALDFHDLADQMGC